MVKLFYKDKVIIFDSKNNNILQKDVLFNDKPTVDVVLEQLNELKSLVVVSDDVEKAFAHFQKDFKAITAAGGLVRNKKGEILMIYRNERWDLPKGKLEVGETIEACAVREVKEETGIDHITTEGEPVVTLHFYNIYGCWELKTTYWYPMVYDGADEVIFTPQAIEGITKCEWLSPVKAEILSHSGYAAIKEVLKIASNKLI